MRPGAQADSVAAHGPGAVDGPGAAHGPGAVDRPIRRTGGAIRRTG
jgi:hypothetical protein